MGTRYEHDTYDTNVEVVAGPALTAKAHDGVYVLGADDFDDVEDESGLELAPGQHAVVIGDPWASAFAVYGTLDQLRHFALRLAAEVHAALPATAPQN
ncbi:MAG: hypothetical protein HOV68_33655 [Streptomycetaceae bacterium]|nr:hypothetical protein [Streptomycetaceae bacterium]